MKRILLPGLYLALGTLFLSCSKSDTNGTGGACGNGTKKFLLSATVDPHKPFKTYGSAVSVPGEIQILYQDSVVQFITEKNVNDVCSKEHLKIYFSAQQQTKTLIFPVSDLKVFGEAYYGFANRRGDLYLSNYNDVWIGEVEVGLEQQFKDKPGDVNVLVTVEFKSLGSRAQDSAFFTGWFNYLKAESNYSVF
jgi:hypothetical protein